MPAISFTVPRARGQCGRNGERHTFAVLVVRVDRTQADEAAIIGERVNGVVATRPGSLLFVYGEDRAADGRIRAHCVDLYRVEPGALHRLDFGTFDGAWLGPALASIEAELDEGNGG